MVIESPVTRVLNIFASFSGTYFAIPTVAVMFSGNEHRSWIDITISSHMLHSDKYSYQTMSNLDDSEQHITHCKMSQPRQCFLVLMIHLSVVKRAK